VRLSLQSHVHALNAFHRNLGWIHFRRAVEGLVGEAEVDAEFNLAAQFYIKAALGFDQDDEFYACASSRRVPHD
jgi:hypothetical protein